MQNNSITQKIVYSGNAYPEISRATLSNGSRQITMQTTKDFLFAHGYISATDVTNDNLDYATLTRALYQAFEDGVLSLNATKQDGVSNYTIIRVSSGLSGKLDTVLAISTISLANPFCLARMENPDLVCNKCYVSESLRIAGILAYTQNLWVLTHIDLSQNPEFIPVIKADWTAARVIRDLKKAHEAGKIDISDAEIAEIAAKKPLCRLESMGDLACTLQSRNYLTIANANATRIDFALWTKNPAVLASAIDIMGKPENLSTVLSMSRKNMMDKAAFIQRYSCYFDHMFIVVDNDVTRDGFLSRDGFYSCHCEHYSCIRCRRCYIHDNTVVDTAVERLRDKKQR